MVLLTGVVLAQQLPPVARNARTDLQGDLLPEGAVLRLGSIRPGVRGYVTSIAWAPDGKSLVTGNDDNVIRIWDARTGHELRRLDGHSNRVWAVDFSYDGIWLASCSSDKTIRIWEADTGGLVRQFGEHQQAIRTVKFSPDALLVASGSEDRQIILSDPFTGKTRRTLRGHSNVVRALGFSSDGRLLASGSDDLTIRLWETATGKERGTFTGHSDKVRSVAIAPDGGIVGSGSDDLTIRLWNVSSGRIIREIRGHAGAVFAVVFSPDGQWLATASPDNTLRLWEVATGQEISRFAGHQDWVVCTAFSPDGRRLASGSADRTGLVWPILPDAPARPAAYAELPESELDICWQDLASDDSLRAFRTIARLIQTPRQSLEYLRPRLRPVDPVAPDHIEHLIRDLDHQRFVQRKQATEELERLGEMALVPLRKVLESRPSLEVRQRVISLLQKGEGGQMPPERLRSFRALQVLERLDLPEALDVFQELGRGAPDARFTRAARAAIVRLQRRAAESH